MPIVAVRLAAGTADCLATRRGHCTARRGRSSIVRRCGWSRCQPCATTVTLGGPRILYQDNGRPFTQQAVQTLVQQSGRRANLENDGVHVLRRTFCSHLAMRGAPAKAIQELAGHKDLTTTQRYMHLSPAAIDAAIQLLDSLESIVPRKNQVAGIGPPATSLFFRGSTRALKPSRVRAPSRRRSPSVANTTSSTVLKSPDRMRAIPTSRVTC